ncbi:MAG: hypothetical protein HYZ15_06535 [Sphingobacteriales bacterium]|nr:hypothetical protein [Sphingobacteriales bacterium]
MNLIRFTFIFLGIVSTGPVAYGQQDTLPGRDTLIRFHQYKICKSAAENYFSIPALREKTASLNVGVPVPQVVKPKLPLLKVTGNILYDVNYRSAIDTPYAGNDIYQHTLQTRLDFVYKGRYPFKLYLTTRFGNSPLFRNYTDLFFQFNQADFRRVIKERVMEAVTAIMVQQISTLDSLKDIIEKKRIRALGLGNSIQGNALSQRIVEEREKEYYRNSGLLPNEGREGQAVSIRERGPLSARRKSGNDFLDSLGLNKEHANRLSSVRSSYLQQGVDTMAGKKAELDSLLVQLDRAEILYRNTRTRLETDLKEIRKQVDGARDLKALFPKLKQLGVPDSVLPGNYKTLSSIQSLGVGRSTADYSELSVKNISITGLQVEYNPRYYYAFAAGKVDYRFRDYIVPAKSHSKQYLAVVRFGKGTRQGNHVFFTYYTGRRQFFNAATTSRPGLSIPGYNLAGFSIEGEYIITRNVSLIAEAAKSTVPYYSLDSLQKSNWLSAVTKFSDRKNEAYAAKLLAYLPKQGTRLSANIRYIGANFQSFSTFTSGASQLRWKGRLEQPFFKRQLVFISSVEQNDYVNPFVNLAYRSSAVLAGLQANLRFKKWPVISVGYYPSFQLVKTGDDQYSESRYYTLSANAGYYYKMGEARAGSYAAYSRFYNEAGDSGFVYYNSTNWLLTQHVTFAKCSFVINASVNANTDYRIWSLENSMQLSVSRIVSLGAGVKMVRHSILAGPDWGYSGNFSIKVPRLGELQFMLDKGFIPGMNRHLAENRMGRLTYYKTF